ncbi:hypothetical protein CRG98_030636 [Punica granatum]|uniref:Uncharacterized protein n=1 Tax=Punica granatum TaxID=22663 RepID=A0A2I0IY84_PUNGR|nr:hypothetical protein CRG98_030636 [Punica granatum]
MGVRTRMWTLVGASKRAFGSRGLGVSTFLWGCVTDTREKESPLIILRPEGIDLCGTGKSEFGSSCYVRAYIPHAHSVLWFARLACFIIYRIN